MDIASKYSVKTNGSQPKKILSVDIGGTKIKFLASGETEPRKIAIRRRAHRRPRWSRRVREAHARLGATTRCRSAIPAWSATTDRSPSPATSARAGSASTSPPRSSARCASPTTPPCRRWAATTAAACCSSAWAPGLGSALIVDHSLLQLELGELWYKRGKTLSRRLGRKGLEKAGKQRWRERVLELVPSLQRAFLADYVVLGGGNSKLIREPLPPGVRLGHNLTAFRGGYRLWGIEDLQTHHVDGGRPGAMATAEAWRVL